MTREEQIIETAKEYYNTEKGTPFSLPMRVGFTTGAQWADETMIDKICKWLKTIDFEMEYMYSDDGYTFFNKEKFINDFRKTMEE